MSTKDAFGSLYCDFISHSKSLHQYWDKCKIECEELLERIEEAKCIDEIVYLSSCYMARLTLVLQWCRSLLHGHLSSECLKQLHRRYISTLKSFAKDRKTEHFDLSFCSKDGIWYLTRFKHLV